VRSPLAEYLPVPRVVKAGEGFALSSEAPKSVGRVRAFYGNFGMLVRAYAYILSLGGDGMKRMTAMAILNANYIRKCLEGELDLPFPEPCLHECVFSDETLEPLGVKTLDVASGSSTTASYAPTIYFPLIVSGAIMIEPTESESRETLDEFRRGDEEDPEGSARAAGAGEDPRRTTRACPGSTRSARRGSRGSAGGGRRERATASRPGSAVLVIPEQAPRDDHMVHLVGAVVEPPVAGLAVHLVERRVAGDAERAVDLDGAVDHVVEHLGSVEFDEG